MSLVPRNTSQLINPDTFKMKVLLCALPGTGKTSWVGTVPGVAVAACETGHGSGLASVATKKVDYVEPDNYNELASFCSGDVFKQSSALAIDSISAMTKTFITQYAISNFPRARGETPKRRAGIPELDDYNTIGECTRRLLAKLLALDKHVIVTATLKLPQEARPEEGKLAQPAVPDLPGQLALAAAAMFDCVLIMRTRPVLRDPKDAKSRYTQRYLLTQGNDQWTAKSRLTVDDKPILPEEVPFDLQSGEGTFPWVLEKILTAYRR